MQHSQHHWLESLCNEGFNETLSNNIVFSISTFLFLKRNFGQCCIVSKSLYILNIRSHANELRAEFATGIKDPKAVDNFLSQVAKDWKSAKLNSVDHTLCVFAQKLTLTQGKMLETDV